MDYKKPYKNIAEIRQALKPVLTELLKDTGTHNLAYAKDLELVSEAIEKLADGLTNAQIPERIQADIDITKVEQSIERLIEATESNATSLHDAHIRVEGFTELRDTMARLLKNSGKPTDPANPSDYINVRLTDGRDFYNAVKRIITAAQDVAASTDYVASDGITPARVQLTSAGQIPTTATLTADNITVAASGIFTNPPGITIATSGVITSVSGTQFANIVNFPTNQTVIRNPTQNAGVMPYSNNNLLATGISIKGSAGQLFGWFITNNASSVRYVKLYDSASAPTVGTTTPYMRLALPANSAANVPPSEYGIPFQSGIGIGATTGVADSDTTAPSANDVIVNIFYA